jgi:hypothetical protein
VAVVGAGEMGKLAKACMKSRAVRHHHREPHDGARGADGEAIGSASGSVGEAGWRPQRERM